MIRRTKETIDSTYAEVNAYINNKGHDNIILSYLHLLFSVSQSEEVRDVYDFFYSGRDLPIVESYHDLEASYELMKLGFFKQAFASLRMGRDNGILAAHWCARGYETEDFRKWLSAETETPWRKQDLWKPIKQLDGVEEFFLRFSFCNVINNLNTLSDYVHTRGFRHSTMGEWHRAMRAGNKFIDCDKWYDLFVTTTRLVITLQLLVNPKLAIIAPIGYLLRKFGTYNSIPFCGILFGDYSSQIKACVGEAEYEALVGRAEHTAEVKDVRAFLGGVPDLSDEEVRRRSFSHWSSLGLDKLSVERAVKEDLVSVRQARES